jgi:CBS domain-containing protein
MDTITTRKGIRGMNDPHRSAHLENGDLVDSSRRAVDAFVSALEGPGHEVIPGGREEPRVREIMTSDVRTCRADRTLICAGTAMHRGDCRFLPVVDSAGKPIGVITDGDICEIGTTDHRPLREILVSEAMSPEVFTCRPEDGIRQVLETMKRHRIRHLPVVDSEGRLVGVVSLTDVILSVEECGQEIAGSLRPLIAGVLRVISQKERGTRTVLINPFRED